MAQRQAMARLRQLLKRYAPRSVRAGIQDLRSRITAPPSEDANLHGYELVRDTDLKPRLSLVIPTISPEVAFGGVLTGIDFFLELGRKTGAELRLILDDYTQTPDVSVLEKRAWALGLDPKSIAIVPRRDQTPKIAVRSSDVFLTFNWWVTLNVRTLILQQSSAFTMEPQPYLYLIQDYEPQFYPFSSSHMMARLALDMRLPYWGIFNTTELHDYCEAQGHHPARSFVFQPKISESLRPFLSDRLPRKEKRILVYGRPSIPRNCFPAICRGLRAWIDSDPDHGSWDIVSAGTPHRPIPLAKGRAIRSVGKLPLEDYARLLQRSSVGLSLMSSPHPSYPPLEMAHFGILTITNRYANKDMSYAHDNVISIEDVADATISEALSRACRRFDAEPEAGPRGESHIPWFLRQEPFECLDAIVAALRAEVWPVRTEMSSFSGS